MTRVIGSQSDVPDIGDPIVSPWHQDTATKIVHRFANVTARDAWVSPPDGAFCVTLDTATAWLRSGGVWQTVQMLNTARRALFATSSGTLIATGTVGRMNWDSRSDPTWGGTSGTDVIINQTGVYTVTLYIHGPQVPTGAYVDVATYIAGVATIGSAFIPPGKQTISDSSTVVINPGETKTVFVQVYNATLGDNWFDGSLNVYRVSP